MLNYSQLHLVLLLCCHSAGAVSDEVGISEITCGAETGESATSCLATTTSVEAVSGEVGISELTCGAETGASATS